MVSLCYHNISENKDVASQNDVFADDSDEEMKQAIETAAQQLLL